ncbi:ABC-type sugar transport system substrate-binding protein [Nocardia sp. GAS34]|uniref:sugar ABC transporter substrate-binding protein n=1 Tax=unclassified Nocardia TaxID=2637762 RepID=UPI003D1DE1A7
MPSKFSVPIALSACTALCLTLAACGSGAGSDSASPAVSPQAAKAAVDQAETTYTKYTRPQPATGVPALPSAPPQNKRFTIITCPIPVCAVFADGAATAARKLNWKVTTLQTDNTPESYVKLINQVAENPPDALTYIPLMPDSAIGPQLAKLQAAGTKISEASPLGNVLPDNGSIQAIVNGPKATSLSGTLMGSAIVADAKGAARSVFVWDPSFSAGWGPIKDSFEKAVEGAGGSVDVLQVSNANVGKTIASQIVSYLQSHPNTRYVGLPVVDYIPGLTAALQAAGIGDKVKVISRAANSAALAEIKAGTEWASVALELAASGYRVVDQLVRLTMGVALDGLADDAGWQEIVVASNVGQTTGTEPPNYAQTYYTAWRVG